MRRFYTNQPLAQNTTITLCDASFNHWIKVLRGRVGEQAVLFNGHGGEYQGEIVEVTKKMATVHLHQFNEINRNNPYVTTLAIVMSKGDRMDYALQKATEMGVTNIQLLTSERCEVKLNETRLIKKLHSWNGIIISACEQSGLNVLPSLHAPIKLSDFINQNDCSNKLVLAPTQEGKANLPFSINQSFPKEFVLLVGAEGGLTKDEIIKANQQGFKSWCLGERVLRTETAPIAALAFIQAYFQQTVLN